MLTPLCEARKISKDFILPDGQVLHVLDHINIKVYPNEILAIIGPSGCGKSTFLRILSGLIPATNGEIFYHGKRISGLMPNFAFVFQSFALYPWMTVMQNIQIVLKAMNLSEKQIQARTLSTIAMVGLNGFEDAYPREISGGMKQRVGLARALVCHPELLLLDEPFSSLDTFTAEVLRQELVEIWKNKGNGLNSIVLISHDVREVAFLADRIIMLETNPGRIRFIQENKLPRPRDQHSLEFAKLVDDLHDAYSQEEKVPFEKPAQPLAPVLPEDILGFLFYLHRSHKPKDIYQIGTENMDDFKKILANVEAAQLLQFVKVTDHTIALTETGKKYLSLHDRQRRSIWQEQLLQIPIFQDLHQLLQASAKKSLSHKDLVDLVKKKMPGQDPEKQCKILISWGTYGNLFTYHKISRTISG